MNADLGAGEAVSLPECDMAYRECKACNCHDAIYIALETLERCQKLSDGQSGRVNEPAAKNQRGVVSFAYGVVNFGEWGCIWCQGCEVLGNIHESPELLKERTE